jgi:hypothetical protein
MVEWEDGTMRHAWCVPMLVCAVLATPSAIAQEFDRDAYVEERLNAVRAYFDSPNGANERLAMAQQLMSSRVSESRWMRRPRSKLRAP